MSQPMQLCLVPLPASSAECPSPTPAQPISKISDLASHLVGFHPNLPVDQLVERPCSVVSSYQGRAIGVCYFPRIAIEGA